MSIPSGADKMKGAAKLVSGGGPSDAGGLEQAEADLSEGVDEHEDHTEARDVPNDCEDDGGGILLGLAGPGDGLVDRAEVDAKLAAQADSMVEPPEREERGGGEGQ